jgi:membrane-associated phospholipid phosphatase
MRDSMLFCGAVLAMALAAGCDGSADSAMLDAIQGCPVSMSEPMAAAEPAEALGGADVRSDARDHGVGWLALGEQLAQEAGARAGYAPYAERRGPAYPGDFWRSFGRDGKEFLWMLWDDTKATGTNPFSLVCLGLAGVTGIALSGDNGNDQVQRHFQRHDGINHFWDNVGDAGGNPGTHFAIAGAMYVTSMLRGDTKTYEVSKTMLSALALNGISTMVLKVAARTESPNGDEFGWPSGHTSSSFCMATVLHEAYGPWVGVPAFGFAAFVGYERLAARNHDFSDVISGALIGIAIGHAVARNHEMKVLGMEVVPYADPRGAVGLALAREW